MDDALKAAIDNAGDGLADYLKEQSNDAFNSGDQGSAIILRAWGEAIPVLLTALRSFTTPLCPDCDLDPCGCPPKCIHGEFIFGDRIKCAGCDELAALRQHIAKLEAKAAVVDMLNKANPGPWLASMTGDIIIQFNGAYEDSKAAYDALITARTLLQEPGA